ncbi:MAG TPA: DUF885 domain-containing protein [Gemmatimonadales bacterium]|nr:DUF885 domain-containing protein [Gemmatimonadales bacterium]
MAVGALQDLSRSYFDLRWHLDPVAASQAGVTAYDERLGRFDSAALAPHLAALKSITAALEAADVDGLDEEIDRTALLNDARVMVRRLERERPQAKNPEFWLSHLLNGLHILLTRRDRSSADRTRAILARLEDVPALLDDARASLTEPVRVFCETGLRMNEGGLALLKAIGDAVTGDTPEQRQRLGAAIERAAAALAAFEHDLERWSESGSDQFALGEDDFNFRLHYEHALTDTAPELWRYGHRLKAEVEADLAARARRLDGGRSWQDLVSKLRDDHAGAEDLVDQYAREMARAREFVATRALAPIPDAPLEVIPTPPFLRPLIPFAAYESPGAFSPDRTGSFYVTAPDAGLPLERQRKVLRDHCRWELAATALHEGYPGHHLQILHAQAQPSEVRRLVSTPLTVEGWALYCEEMMAEQGFYATEEERFFQRVHLLWRTVRILLDVGLHTRGMGFEQSVDQLVQDLAVERGNAEAEVRRYCAWPAYQLCYAVGRRELLQLREDYRAAKGAAFSLRGFHEAVLSFGGLPVSLMRWGLGLDGRDA